METLETGKDRVKKICEVLKRETLEPAIREAEEIVINARAEAEKILEKAKKKSAKMIEEAQKEIDRRQNVFQASLSQACRQAIDMLKEQIDEKLFNPKLSEIITQPMKDPKVIAQLITTIIKSIEKEGIESDLSVVIPAAIPAREINELLGKEILEKLKEKSVVLGPIKGGIEVKLHRDKITIDMTDKALKELVAGYIRKDFRDFFYETALE
ncbi:MAG TPA: V-type ATP synthase subunit E [Rhabdochlamydiaceae bacterium]|nr:V-type ATP synthase subunit E [Rhabdochlamydiaceae bacterium]